MCRQPNREGDNMSLTSNLEDPIVPVDSPIERDKAEEKQRAK